MPEQITKTQRWLDLIALLLNRRIPLEVEEIMERIPAYSQAWVGGDDTARASVRRMFERDKDELRAMGIPIESTRYEINFGGELLEGYRIQSGDFYLPYLRVLGAGSEASTRTSKPAGIELQPDEARTALDALRSIADVPAFPFVAEARSALSKLTFDLDPELYRSPAVLQLDRSETRELVSRLRILSDALLAGKRVNFRYQGIYRGTPTDRQVEPFGLFFQRDWYLVGRDLQREAVRVFRVSRMEAPAMNTRMPKERDYNVPEEFVLRAYVGRRAWELTDEKPITAEVLFNFPSSLLAGRNGDGELVAENPDGSALRRFEVADPPPFLRWVLGFAGEATLVSPPELREAYLRVANEVASLYGDADG
jgi:proteasome accessory factor B